VPPFDRDATLKAAEKALKTGKVDAAIAEYVKVVESQPRDWNSANTLGDLYVRAKQLDKGVEQYVRIADHLADEGFYPKAMALFKKILKLKPDHEYAMLQSGDLAARQGTMADAKKFFQQVSERRQARGDRKGAAEVAIKLGTLDPDDLDARLRAGQLAAQIGDSATAVHEFREVAARLEKQERHVDALVPLQLAYDLDKSDEATRGRLFRVFVATDPRQAREFAGGAADLKQLATALDKAGHADLALDVRADLAAADPDDAEARASLALTYVARGDFEKAHSFLSADTAGTNAALWLTLAEIELRSHRLAEGRAALAQALTLDRNQAQAAVVLGCKLADSNPDAAYQAVDAAVDVALAESDFAAAAVALHEFTTRVRSHLLALMRLVEICVDGGLEATLSEAQAALADAYLDQDRAMEARIISEDLVAREPWNAVNIDRFRRALEMLGESDPDAIVSERLSGESPFLATEGSDLNEGASRGDHEVDLTEMLDEPAAGGARRIGRVSKAQVRG
jgi:tetratricopeptide (TPR) repeat protein